MKIINIEHLSKTYKSGKIALNDISLQVEENTLFGLLGVNGAGKTTLIKILSGLLKKDTGKVTMASFSLDDDIDEIQKIINISPQETSIAPNLTVKENLIFFSEIYECLDLEYIDKTEGETLDNKTLNKMAWRSMFLQASFNYERMQAGGWLYSILPGLKKIHKNKQDLSTSMKHNLEFFNCHPFLITFVMGIILSLEQKKADIQTIRSLRVAAMGPLGGIGDAIFWFTLLPISAGIGANLSLQGSILGPIIFFVLFNIVHLGLRFGLMHWSYKVGVDGIAKLTKNAKEFTRAATVLGMIVVGALIASYVNVNIVTPEYLSMQGTIDLQSILDSIMPCLLPLAVTFGMYGLVKKNVSSMVNILILVVIGIVGAFLGIFA